MHTLVEAFFIASGCGIWMPRDCTSSIGRALFGAYTLFNLIVMILLLLSELIALILLTESINDFAAASYVFLAGFNGFVKGTSFLWRKRRIGELADLLLSKECAPRTVEEIELCSRYDRMARITVISYVSLVGLSSTATAVWPAFFSREQYQLQLVAWYPYTITTDITYWCTYIHQAFGILIGAAWNVTNDTLIAGFMMQACSQLDLMSLRLRMQIDKSKRAIQNEVMKEHILKEEENLIRESVRHHLTIFRFAKDLKSIFAPSILVQFCLSLIILCITIFELTAKSSKSAPVSFMLIFLSSMLVELFLYCWFGNEVTLKPSGYYYIHLDGNRFHVDGAGFDMDANIVSTWNPSQSTLESTFIHVDSIHSLEFSEAICKSNWPQLQVKTLKGLLIMMIRSTSPIRLTCGPFITLSVNAYTAILKLSYSVFNLLQNF